MSAAKSATIKLTEAELWYLINAIPQAGTEGEPAGDSAFDKISAAHRRIRGDQ